jgi:hypothetical protein
MGFEILKAFFYKIMKADDRETTGKTSTVCDLHMQCPTGGLCYHILKQHCYERTVSTVTFNISPANLNSVRFTQCGTAVSCCITLVFIYYFAVSHAI